MAIVADRFTRFACFDWSGHNVAQPKGIALAIADRTGPPRLVERRWSRDAVLAWLREVAASNEPMLIGLDLSPGFPFADADGYFPGWPQSPHDAKALWALVDAMSAADDHLAATGFLADPDVGRYFRQHGDRRGDRFGANGRGRLRVCETAQPARKLSPSSCFNLVGAAQVGKSSLTGMRVIHRLAGAIAFWPFDPLPAAGPVLVEIYTTIAARRRPARRAEQISQWPGARRRADRAGQPAARPTRPLRRSRYRCAAHRRVAARQRRPARIMVARRADAGHRGDRRLDLRRRLTH